VSHIPTDRISLANALYTPTPHPATGGIHRVFSSTLSALPATLGIGLNASINTKEDVLPWIHVINRFKAFQANLGLTDAQRAEGNTKFSGLVACLNTAYRGHNSKTENSFLIGSWAKDTCIRPPRDVDMYYVLPIEVYHRYERYGPGVNKQSALLQEVKNKLSASYPRSVIRGDGPIVLADFHGHTVEIAPAFVYDHADTSYIVCDTKNGGRYLTTKPFHELIAINNADLNFNNNARPLIRMLKCWQANCSVPIRSFHLELIAIDFLGQWAHKQRGLFYYDWMCRDFFQWMISRANGAVFAPGTSDIMWLGESWKTRAESAYGRAAKASAFEQENNMLAAGDEWQKIFGTDIPRIV
jgi:hypothetical protein